VVTKTQVKYVTPPIEWTEKVEEPVLKGKLNKHLWQYAEEYRNRLEEANKKLDWMRWYILQHNEKDGE